VVIPAPSTRCSRNLTSDPNHDTTIGKDRTWRGYGAARPCAAVRWIAGRVARLLTDVSGRSCAARGDDGPLRCILSLVPRRRRRDPQLAQQQAGSRRITAGLPAPVRGCRGTAFAAHGPQRWLLPARRYCRGQIPRAQCEQKPQGHTEIALRLREGRRRLRSRRGGKNLGSGVALRYPHRCLPVYVFQLGQAIGISVHLGVGDYGSLRG
jgi:hypothetical protein